MNLRLKSSIMTMLLFVVCAFTLGAQNFQWGGNTTVPNYEATQQTTYIQIGALTNAPSWDQINEWTSRAGEAVTIRIYQGGYKVAVQTTTSNATAKVQSMNARRGITNAQERPELANAREYFPPTLDAGVQILEGTPSSYDNATLYNRETGRQLNDTGGGVRMSKTTIHQASPNSYDTYGNYGTEPTTIYRQTEIPIGDYVAIPKEKQLIPKYSVRLGLFEQTYMLQRLWPMEAWVQINPTDVTENALNYGKYTDRNEALTVAENLRAILRSKGYTELAEDIWVPKDPTIYE